VIRRYEGGRQLSVLHLPEDVDNDWSGEEEYRAPLAAFFARTTTPLPLHA
jgi:hypothetical protein